MITLVIGGTGTVGRQVVDKLLLQNQRVRVLSTSEEKAASLPKEVAIVIGDLNTPETLSKAFAGIEKVYLLNAQSQAEVQQGFNALEAARQAGVSKIVYQSIYNARITPEFPLFQPKVAIENAIQASGLEYAFICPNIFYQNDFCFQEAINTYGIYPQPVGDIGLSRVDVRDVAEAAVKVLLSDDYNGQSIPLVGPEVQNAANIVRVLSKQLGHEVKYLGNDLISWAMQAKLSMHAWKVDGWVLMYDFLQKKGLAATDEDLAKVTQVLGKPPRSYESFIMDHPTYFSRNLTNN